MKALWDLKLLDRLDNRAMQKGLRVRLHDIEIWGQFVVTIGANHGGKRVFESERHKEILIFIKGYETGLLQSGRLDRRSCFRHWENEETYQTYDDFKKEEVTEE